MPDNILDMRFNQNPEDPLDDEEFLQATYWAGIQVEKKKALKQAKETMRSGATTAPKDSRKEGENRKTATNGQRGKEPEKPPQTIKPSGTEGQGERPSWAQYGKQGHWPTKADALKGVPQKEQDEYLQSQDNCWRCGMSGHRTYECFAHTTRRGTTLPKTP